LNKTPKNCVWEIVPRGEARRDGWRSFKSRWIDNNKSVMFAFLYRSRLVGKGCASKKVGELFVGTPPLGALRLLVYEAATVEGKAGVHLMSLCRACFGTARRSRNRDHLHSKTAQAVRAVMQSSHAQVFSIKDDIVGDTVAFAPLVHL